MSKRQNFFVNLVTYIIIIAIASCYISSPASAVTQELQLNTTAGYIVKTTFSYDDAQNPEIISEHGPGKTKSLDYLEVSFYRPSGEFIASYNNVIDGIAKGTYFEFSFEPTSQHLLGSIDIGGESVGEIYLKGEMDRELSLVEVETSGEERVIDRVMRTKEQREIGQLGAWGIGEMETGGDN